MDLAAHARLAAYAPAGALIVTVKAHMWWWEVRYRDPATGADIVTANEIRIPVGKPVYLALTSADVIHSFWVPQLAGKMDMLPGRMQHLLVTATAPGTWRGQCAEFCGEQHAQMALHVVGLAPPILMPGWRCRRSQPSRPQPRPWRWDAMRFWRSAATHATPCAVRVPQANWVRTSRTSAAGRTWARARSPTRRTAARGGWRTFSTSNPVPACPRTTGWTHLR